MIKSISIKNYKKFKNEIKIDFENHKSKKVGEDFILEENISSVIGILGKNASGKLTIINAIKFYFELISSEFFNKLQEDAYINKIEFLLNKLGEYPQTKGYKEKYKKINQSIKNLKNDSIPILKKEIFKIFSNIYYEKANNKKEPIKFKIDYFEKNRIMSHTLEILENEIDEKIYYQNQLIYQNLNPSILGFNSNLLFSMYQKQMQKIILFSNSQFIKNTSIKFKNIIQKIPKKAQMFLLDYVQIADETVEKFLKDEEGVIIGYVSSLDGSHLALNCLSDGTKLFINLYHCIYHAIFKEKSLLLIHEIENALHFSLIKFIITIFKQKYNKLNSQLLFSTHNPLVFDDDFKSNSIYFIDNDKLIRNNNRFDKKITPGYLRGELISNPNYKYCFNFLKNINSFHKDNH